MPKVKLVLSLKGLFSTLWNHLTQKSNCLASRSRRICTIFDGLHIDDKKKMLEAQANRPDLWQNPEKAEQVLKELKRWNTLTEKWDAIRNKIEELKPLLGVDDSDMQTLVTEEVKALETSFKKAHVELFLNGPYDANDVVLVISAGTGGVDAQDWAEMLLRMYLRYTEKKGLKTSLLEKTGGGEAGIKSATLSIKGILAYGYLKYEHGVHRMVRLSPFNAKNLRQTSFALVEVLPVTTPETVEIDDKDLRIDTFRSSGAGGQNVNKTESAVRITHLPTGIAVACQTERSQIQNRAHAMEVLRGKLIQKMEEEHKGKIGELKGDYKEAAWGNQIRSYVFQPYTLVKDHRTDVETSQVQAVMDGELDLFIEANLIKLSQKET